MTNSITISATDGSGSFSAYIALPKKLPAPAVIVIQEIFGINAEMRAKCDEFAALGYVAVAPDLFWRMEPGVQLTDKTDAEWQRAFDFFNRFDVDKGIEDLKATLETLRERDDVSGKIGCTGYCLGGKLAYLMATRSSVDCAVSYYGVGLDGLLREAKNIKKPLMLHMAELDKFVNPQAQQAIKEGFKDNALVTIHSYPGVDHAFARGQGVNYNEAAATLANSHTAAFFKEHLTSN